MAKPVGSYFDASKTWRERLGEWLSGRAPGSGAPDFVAATGDHLRTALQDPDTGLRVVVNIAGKALLDFLDEGRYKNAYEFEREGHPTIGPSDTRKRVDSLLRFREPQGIYFGAVALNGTGVRFYGEYCLVLDHGRVDADPGLFDRNSYDLVRPPLGGHPNLSNLVNALEGEWTSDVVDMALLRVLPELEPYPRLTTIGPVSDAILRDEEFMEVHLHQTFGPVDIAEVRLDAMDQARYSEILFRYRSGVAPTPEEILWCSRRALVARRLADRGICCVPSLMAG